VKRHGRRHPVRITIERSNKEKSMIATMILAAVATAAVTSVAFAQSTPSASSGPVAVVVSIPIPPGVSREQTVAGMQKAVPQYQALPGLARKYFTLSDDGKFGGIYLWNSRAEAQAWFSDAWRAKATATYGAAPQVTYFDAPIVIENPAR
jgi:hypothetical protein